MDKLRSMEAFVRVAETLSFARAAHELEVSKSVLSTRVQQLEELVGAPLVHRTTRTVSLTPVGAAFLPECAALLSESARLLERMRDAKGSPSGRLRIHVLSGFALALGKQLHAFQSRYPSIALDVVVNDTIIDPAREGFDCALQIFQPSSDALVMRRLVPWRPIFCAAPTYLHAQGEPKTPRDLLKHRVGLYSRYPSGDTWAFERGGKTTRVELTPYLRSNSVHLLCDYACAGAGVVCLPTLLASGPLHSGALRPVLPDYALAPFWLCAVYPSARSASVKLRLFLESLRAAFPGADGSGDAHDDSAEAPWDRDLRAQGMLPPLPQRAVTPRSKTSARRRGR